MQRLPLLRLHGGLACLMHHLQLPPGLSWLGSSSRCMADDAAATRDSPPGESQQQQHQQHHHQHHHHQHQHTPDFHHHEQQQEHLSPFQASPDVFTRALQSRTEQEVADLLERAREAARAAAAAEGRRARGAGLQEGAGGAGDGAQEQEEQAEEGEEDTLDAVNPETGEVYGPRGKEPTRFGDWEFKGRCTDFS